MSSQSPQGSCDAPRMESASPGMFWLRIHNELACAAVTLKLLWSRCRSQGSYTGSYSHFCRSYRHWLDSLGTLLQYRYTAGEKLLAGFIDLKDSYAVDSTTGEAFPTCIFLAVLGFSLYCFAEFCTTKSIDSWIAGHFRALDFFQGTSKCFVPILGESSFHLSRHASYQEFARRCCVLIQDSTFPKRLPSPTVCKEYLVFDLPAQWLASSMCHQRFAGIAEAQAALEDLIQHFNNRPFEKLPGTPREWFETLERPCLLQIHTCSADHERWLQPATTINTTVDPHHHSAQPTMRPINANVTPDLGRVVTKRQPTKPHPKKDRPGKSSSEKVERRTNPQKIASNWSPARLIRWARKIGPATAYLATTILTHANNSPAGVRACLGLLTLETDYGRDRLEAACRLFATSKSWTLRILRSSLSRGADQDCLQLKIPGLSLPLALTKNSNR
jgi:hypothetical protein